LVERYVRNVEAVGSNPITSTEMGYPLLLDHSYEKVAWVSIECRASNLAMRMSKPKG
jgi:hypothetical protein